MTDKLMGLASSLLHGDDERETAREAPEGGSGEH